MTARELSSETGLALPTSHHLLRTLVHEGYLVRVGDGTYAVGQQCRSAADLERRTRSIPCVRRELRRLSDAAGVHACLAALVDDRVRVLQHIVSPRAPRLDWSAGVTVPAHATAVGKCVLAQLPVEDRRAYLLRHPPEPLTARTIVDVEHHMQADGPIYRAKQEFAYGIACVATPVGMPGTVGALGALYASHQLRSRVGLDDLLRESAHRLSAIEFLSGREGLETNPPGRPSEFGPTM
jgi:IclR family transcriptional regulator, acetate operon repressor